MSFEERGGQPQRLGDFVHNQAPETRTVYDDEEVFDAQARRIRVVRHPREVEVDSTRKTIHFGKSYKCKICRDRGVINYVREKPHGDRVIDYSFVARCFCPASRNVSQTIETYHEIFGEWPKSDAG